MCGMRTEWRQNCDCGECLILKNTKKFGIFCKKSENSEHFGGAQESLYERPRRYFRFLLCSSILPANMRICVCRAYGSSRSECGHPKASPILRTCRSASFGDPCFRRFPRASAPARKQLVRVLSAVTLPLLWTMNAPDRVSFPRLQAAGPWSFP